MDKVNFKLPCICFNVEKILEVASISDVHKSYKVQWAASWISGNHLIGCDDLIRQFNSEHTEKGTTDESQYHVYAEVLYGSDNENSSAKPTDDGHGDAEAEQVLQSEIIEVKYVQTGSEDNFSSMNYESDLRKPEDDICSNYEVIEINPETAIKTEETGNWSLHENVLPVSLDFLKPGNLIAKNAETKKPGNARNEEQSTLNDVDMNEPKRTFPTNIYPINSFKNNNTPTLLNSMEHFQRIDDNYQDSTERMDQYSFSFSNFKDTGNKLDVNENYQPAKILSAPVSTKFQGNPCTEPNELDIDDVFPASCSNDMDLKLSIANVEAGQRILTYQYQPKTIENEEERPDQAEGSSSPRRTNVSSHAGYPCKRCDDVNFSLKMYLVHVHAVHDRYPCRVCLEEFDKKIDCRLHEIETHNINRSTCDECGHKFCSPQYLKVHMKRKHTNEKPFQCSLCKKGFCTAYDLKIHERVHTGARPYVCEFCNQRFTQSSSYHGHVRRKHSVNKHFNCADCSKSFSSKPDLRKHNCKGVM